MHIENIQGAHKHIKEKRHKKNIMVRFHSCSVSDTTYAYLLKDIETMLPSFGFPV